jgi:predicted porin
MLAPGTLFAASSVTMFGIADVYVGFQDDDRAGGDSGVVVNSGGQSTSRWGVLGSEDLGGGLSAIFRLESGLNVDVGQGQTASGTIDFRRRSFVGLKGNFGQITLGRDYTPLFWTVIDNDTNRFSHDVNDGNLGQANRTDNGVNYQRKFGGLTLNALYAATENGGDDIFGIGLRYKTKSWRIGLGYHDEAGTKVVGLGGLVSFGGFKVGLNAIDDDANPELNYGLSASANVGASGNIAFNAKKRNTQTHFQLYYRHKLSKRTNWYVGYGDEDTNGSEFRAGIRHRF